MDRIKQQAAANILKNGDSPNFQTQVANGQSGKPLATATLNNDGGDKTFAKHFVVMKNLTGPIMRLRFVGHSSVFSDTTHGLNHFLYLTMHVIGSASERSTEPQSLFFALPW